jgi:hypothetical protein
VVGVNGQHVRFGVTGRKENTAIEKMRVRTLVVCSRLDVILIQKSDSGVAPITDMKDGKVSTDQTVGEPCERNRNLWRRSGRYSRP